MTESPKAVFLSYASQDTEAERRVCESLHAACVEVWFDQSELRVDPFLSRLKTDPRFKEILRAAKPL
ncbi:MAG: toll/interleukin-1 receptor domain-containing protein [Verrucomicrobia bacterium]|nr:toll/interleukin-1 receptor domain-containing protein [Verrucomicrobiota bacterium]